MWHAKHRCYAIPIVLSINFYTHRVICVSHIEINWIKTNFMNSFYWWNGWVKQKWNGGNQSLKNGPLMSLPSFCVELKLDFSPSDDFDDKRIEQCNSINMYERLSSIKRLSFVIRPWMCVCMSVPRCQSFHFMRVRVQFSYSKQTHVYRRCGFATSLFACNFFNIFPPVLSVVPFNHPFHGVRHSKRSSRSMPMPTHTHAYYIQATHHITKFFHWN